MTYPEEREHVVGGLDKGIEKLESGIITPGIIRATFERLKTVGRRFAGSSKEITITGARQALIEFVKKHMSELLAYVWTLF